MTRTLAIVTAANCAQIANSVQILIGSTELAARILSNSLALLIMFGSIYAGPILGQANLSLPPDDVEKNILILYSYGHGGKGIAIFDEGLVTALSAGGIATNNLFFEFLDLERNKPDPHYRSRMQESLRRKFSYRHIDAIITVQQPALNFLLNEGRAIASGVPAITVQAPMPTVAEAGERRFISQLARFDVKGTLERALELFPDTRRVVFVSGSSEADRTMAADAASISAPWQDKLEFEYTFDLALEAMLKRVASLPARTIIIFTQYNRDSSGRVTVAYEVEGMIVKVANAPVFGLYDFNLSNGGIGGSVVSVRKLGEHAGQLALDLLSGKLRLSQPVTSATNEVIAMFDWDQIKRWGGDPNRLSRSSVFVNRVPTFWERYRLYLIGLGFFVLVQSLFIAALLVNSRRKKQAEESLARTNADLQRFAEVTAHHLQEPARRIATYAERLCMQLGGRLDDAEARLSLEFIGQEARRQQNLLRDVERYLASDQPRGKVEPVDARKAVAGILARWQDRIGEAGAEIALGNLPPTRIDLPRLDDVFSVALDNALTHGRGAHPFRITIEGERQGGKVRYSVSDNGPGVEEQYRERVFRVFERLTTGGDITGTGIGLAILRRVAESCGGRAWIEETPGGGCSIVFELPMGEPL